MATFLPSMAAEGFRMGAMARGCPCGCVRGQCGAPTASRVERWSLPCYRWGLDAARAGCTRYLSLAPNLRCERLAFSRGSWPLAGMRVLATRKACLGRPRTPACQCLDNRKNPSPRIVLAAAARAKPRAEPKGTTGARHDAQQSPDDAC